MNTEEVAFNVILSSTWWKNPPQVKIWLNDELIETTSVMEKTEENKKKNISFTSNLPEGENKLIIEFFGKKNDETVLDKNDPPTILKDQLLSVDDIEIDEISLGYLIYSQGTFYPDKEMHPYAPDEMKDMVVLGFNGKLELKFQVPTYIWFLENL